MHASPSPTPPTYVRPRARARPQQKCVLLHVVWYEYSARAADGWMDGSLDPAARRRTGCNASARGGRGPGLIRPCGCRVRFRPGDPTTTSRARACVRARHCRLASCCARAGAVRCASRGWGQKAMCRGGKGLIKPSSPRARMGATATTTAGGCGGKARVVIRGLSLFFFFLKKKHNIQNVYEQIRRLNRHIS